MRFKMALCQVLCLVITAMLHSTTAELDALSIEALVDSKVDMIVDKLTQTYKAQNKDVIEKQAESLTDLIKVVNNLLTVLLKIENQLTKVTNDLHQHKSDGHQEKAKLNDIHTVVRGTYAQNKEVVAKVASHATDAQHMAAAVRRLGNTTDNLLAGHLEIRKQLTSVKSAVHQSTLNLFPPSCATLAINATNSYFIRPFGAVEPFLVLCDFEDNYGLGGGWTVFQHRYDGSVDFYRNWTMYRDGFGDVNGEYWLGLEKLHAMTKSGKHELLIIMEDFDQNTTHVHYKEFKIGSEDEKYKLFIKNYSKKTGDSLNWHNGRKFTTFDQDNDENQSRNCAVDYRGAWWFHRGSTCHLNGVYHKKGKHVTEGYDGVTWFHWKGSQYSLKSTKMMLRRRSG